jgi:hypothetical protein
LPEGSRRKRAQGKYPEEKKKMAHRELYIKSLRGINGERKGVETCTQARNCTTRCRHIGKKLAIFCDFLLTPHKRSVILRIQIRATWKRQAD